MKLIFFQYLKLFFVLLLVMLVFWSFSYIVDYITINFIEEKIGFYFAYFISKLFLVLTVIAVYLYFYKKQKKKDVFLKQFDVAPILIIILFLVVILPFYQYNNIISEQPIRHNKDVEIFSITTLTFLFRLSIIGPIMEELIFRGIIFKSLIKKDKLGLSLILSGILFVLYHYNYFAFSFDIRHSFVLFSFSFILGIIYYKTKNILYPILVHMVYNTSIALIINRNYFIDFINLLEFGIWYWFLILASLFLVIYLLVKFYRKESQLYEVKS